MKIRFHGCKHLDFEPDYRHCKRQLIQATGGVKLCWRRVDDGDLVQFCSRRGRVNNPVSCLDQSNTPCHDYKETERTIDVSEEELES